MTEPDLPDLPDLDRTARAAARGLRDHLERHLDPEPGLARIPLDGPSNRGGRILVAAAVLLLVLGGLAIAGSHDGGVRIDEDHRHPIPAPMALAPLGPTDGKDSMSLPVTAEPHTALRDHQRVDVHATGFAPGEPVGIVECAHEAGPATKGGRGGGIDACSIAHYTSLKADADGVVDGSYAVDRFLTTSLTGTVDCASEAGRCLVAVGAIGDYDRSGGYAIDFAAGEPGDAPDIPTLTVSPAEGLADGDLVRVRGEGYHPSSVVLLQVCSADPSGCWSTGESIAGQGTIGLKVDGHGRIDGKVPVWQFLPANEPGRYVDCAVSACALRVQTTGEGDLYAPAPAPLAFAPGHSAPAGPSFRVDPDHGLAPDAEVDLTGGGFAPGSGLTALFCVARGPYDPAAAPGLNGACSNIGGIFEVHDDGTVIARLTLPDPAGLGAESCADSCGTGPTTTACATDGCAAASTSTAVAGAPHAWCDGVTTHCTISLDSQDDGATVAPPYFAPTPIQLIYGPR